MAKQRTYTPALPAELIHQLWLLKQTTGEPMTDLLREAVERFLDTMERE